MPEFTIDSLTDPRLDPYRDLKRANEFENQSFVAEGEKLVCRLLESPCVTRSVLCTEAALADLRSRVRPETPVYVATTPVISQLVGFPFHRGVLACGARPDPPRLETLLAELDPVAPALAVICPELRDPTNLGSIIRSAAAFGARFLVAGHRGTQPFSRRVLRTSMGSVLTLPIVQTDDWPAVLATLHSARFETVATVLSADAEPLQSARLSARTALLLGNEDQGLSPALAAQCRRRVTLPMASGIDSLNVAVAAGIVLYAATRSAETAPEMPGHQNQ